MAAGQPVILPVDQWLRSAEVAQDKPWLILGKGPSHSLYGPTTADRFNVIALNHAMAGVRVLVGHTVDIEVLDALVPGDLAEVRCLCLPWVPHVRRTYVVGGTAFFGPGELNLAQWCERNATLRHYAERGCLLSYNLHGQVEVERNSQLPRVRHRTFSGALVAGMLAEAGVRELRTLGVDGGSSYAPAFRAIEDAVKLQTGQQSYDAQFAELAELLLQHDGIRFGPADAQLPVRVFVGCMPEQELAFQVLACSIARHASLSTRVVRLHEAVAEAEVQIPVPADPRNHARTPFSFQRFAIPELCRFEGRAIYLDSDMLVFRDIRALWLRDMRGRQMLAAATAPGDSRRPQFSVMLLDCAALRWSVPEIVARLDAGETDYEGLMYRMSGVADWAQDLPWVWNSLERYDPKRTALLHFTDMSRQPWLNPLHPFGSTWTGYLLDGVRGGFIPASLVRQEVDRGNVRPSLLEQLASGDPDPRRLPFRTIRRDLLDFCPPHMRQRTLPSRLRYEVDKALRSGASLGRDRLYRPVVRRAKTGLRRLSYFFMR